jgi:hypothetical protein
MDCNNCTHLRAIEHCNPNLEHCVCVCPTQWVDYNDYPPKKVTVITTDEAIATGICKFERKKKWF